MHDELEKMQRALNQTYADRDKIASEMDKVRDDLERSQVYLSKVVHIYDVERGWSGANEHYTQQNSNID
jgi:hypothetical protein